MTKYNFQNCQKIVVFSKDFGRVLLCKRKNEQDFDGKFSFIGGKMEITDKSFLAGLKREKDEEVGEDFKIKIYSKFTTNILFTKKDGNVMILPHYLAIHESGEIDLSEEYSEFKWVNIDIIGNFEPKVQSIPEVIKELLRIKKIIEDEEFVVI